MRLYQTSPAYGLESAAREIIGYLCNIGLENAHQEFRLMTFASAKQSGFQLVMLLTGLSKPRALIYDPPQILQQFYSSARIRSVIQKVTPNTRLPKLDFLYHTTTHRIRLADLQGIGSMQSLHTERMGQLLSLSTLALVR